MFKIVLAIWGPFYFHMNFRIGFSISKKKPIGILIGATLSLWSNLGGTVVLMTWSPDS